MRSGETITVKDLCDNDKEINEVVIYPQLNKQHTMFWKVEGMFGSCRFTLCLTKDRQEAKKVFEEINERLLDLHEKDLKGRFY